ncbi:MAG: PhnD/SsuA/transferrin family substrate-binding protein [Gallionella sp.]
MSLKRIQLFLIGGLLCLQSLSVQAAEPLVLNFATYASERPSEELKKMEPFCLYLEQKLARQGIPVKVKMRIYPQYEQATDAVENGEADFARLGPVSYIITKNKKPNIQLLAMESNQGGKFIQGVILVAINSPIRSMFDLKGTRFAFGEENSTTGRYLAQEALMQAGITGRHLAKYEYIGRHDKVAFAVAAGSYDAGAVNETVLEKYAYSKGLRKLISYSSPSHAWVGRAGLDARVVGALQKALFGMKGSVLKYIGRDGFLPAQDADYDSLRNTMNKVKSFEH